MRKSLVRLVALVMVVSGWSSAPPAVATVILYQTSFDTDTTDVPGTYAPLSFDAAGYEHDYYYGPSIATDATSFTQDGVLHIARSSTSHSSVGWARPELTLSSQDLIGHSAFPEIFTLSVEMGGTPGSPSWWGTMIKFDDREHPDIHYGFHPGIGYANFGLGINSSIDYTTTTAAANQFLAEFNTLYEMGVTVTDLDGSYRFDLSVTNPATSIEDTDSKVVPYAYPISTIGIGRWGPGGGDAIFDNLTISTPIPEPNTALLLGFGLVGLGVKRRRRTD
jgi:hypothetical protein